MFVARRRPNSSETRPALAPARIAPTPRCGHSAAASPSRGPVNSYALVLDAPLVPVALGAPAPLVPAVAVEPAGAASRLTITDDYAGLPPAEREERLHEVDRSLTAWGWALHEYLRLHARRTPDKAAVIWYGRKISWAELDDLSDEELEARLLARLEQMK